MRTHLSLLPLVAGFVAVVALFVTSTVYSQHTASAIHDEAMVIALDDAPSIEHLAMARAAILRLPRLVAEHITAVRNGQTPPRTPIALEWDAVNRELEVFLALPTYPEENAGARDIRRTLAVVDGAIPRALDAADAGDWRAAERILHEEIEPFADRSTATIQSVILVDAGHVERTAARVEKLRRRSAYFAFGLDAVSVVLSVAIAAVVLRFVRQYSSILEERKTWLERRSEELEQFAGRVAHDVRAPLAPVAMALGLAARDTGCSERTRNAANRGVASLQRLRGLIEDLLAFARAGAAPESGARAAVTDVLADVLAESEPAATQSGIELSVEPFAPCSVACAPGVLSSILSNLVGNAIKYIGEEPVKRVTVRVDQRPNSVRVEVEDTGPGLAPDVAERVFEPYTRGANLTQPGIGLGLATVKRLVEGHGGSVGVSSAPGRGTTFWITLPRAPTPSEAPTPMKTTGVGLRSAISSPGRLH